MALGTNVTPTCGQPGEEGIGVSIPADVWTPLFSVSQQENGSMGAAGVAYITVPGTTKLLISRYPGGPGGSQLGGGTIAWPYQYNVWVQSSSGTIEIDFNSFTVLWLDPKQAPTGAAPTS